MGRLQPVERVHPSRILVMTNRIASAGGVYGPLALSRRWRSPLPGSTAVSSMGRRRGARVRPRSADVLDALARAIHANLAD
jgi:hypothetical protein